MAVLGGDDAGNFGLGVIGRGFYDWSNFYGFGTGAENYRDIDGF